MAFELKIVLTFLKGWLKRRKEGRTERRKEGRTERRKEGRKDTGGRVGNTANKV